MAVALSGGPLLYKLSAWDYNAAYTVAFWVKTDSTPHTYGTPFTIGGSAWPHIDGLQFDTDGLTLTLTTAGASAVTGTTLSADTWYHLAVVRTSDTDIYAYLNGVQDITKNASVTGRNSSYAAHFGDWWVGDGSYLDGKIASIKIYTAALTPAEIVIESQTVMPRRFADLWGWYPLLPGATERLIDYSANGRTLLASGTPADGDSPPIAWGAPVWMVGLDVGSGTQDIQPTGLASTEAYGNPTITPGAVDIQPTGIASTLAFGSPTVTSTVDVQPTGIASGVAYGNPTIAAGAVTVAPTGIASTVAFGSPTTTIDVQPTGLASGVVFGTLTIAVGALDIQPTGIASTVAYGSPTLTVGAVDIQPTGIASILAFGVPTVTSGVLDIQPTGIASTLVFGTLAVTIDVQPTGIASTLVFGNPTIIPAASDIQPTGIASTVAYGSPTLSGVATILPTGIASTVAYGNPTVVGGGAQDIQPTGIASTVAFGVPIVAGGVTTIAPTGIASTLAFGTLTVIAGVVDVQPTAIASTVAYGNPSLSSVADIQPTGIASTLVFGNPTIIPAASDIQPASITGTVFGTLTLTATYALLPTGIASTVVFGTLTQTNLATILPTGKPSGVLFGTPVLAGGDLVADNWDEILRRRRLWLLEHFGTSLGLDAQPTGIASTVAFGNPTVIYGPAVEATSIASTVTFGTLTLTNLAALVPLVSEGFTFVWGAADGRGHAAGEASYLDTTAGMGGAGAAWSVSAGSTWRTNNGRGFCNTLGGSTAQTWVDVGLADVRAEVDAIYSAGSCGLLLRYVDSSNYADATITSTNVRIRQRVGGTVTTLTDIAVTIVSDATIVVELSGAGYTLYYNDVAIDTGTLNAVLTSATKFGLFTNNTGNTFNNFVAYDLAAYPAGIGVSVTIAQVTVSGTSTATSAFIPGGTVTQHSFVNATDTDLSRTSSDPLWGTLGVITLHQTQFGFSGSTMTAQASGGDEATRVANTIAGENINFAAHDAMLTLLAANGVTEIVLKAWGYPLWMLDATTGPDAVNRTFLTTYRAEAAAFTQAFIKRYNTDTTIAGISIVAVDWGHEWKGYTPDQARFVNDYNAVYAAVKAEDSSVDVGGPYRVVRGNGTRNFGQAVSNETREPIVSDDGDKIAYFIANADGFDFLSFDAKTWVAAAPTLTYDEAIQMFGYWARYIQKMKEITGYGSQPLMLSEGYGFNINDYADFSEAEQGALHAAMFYYLVLHGVGHFFQWIVENPSGQARYGYWNSTDDNPTSSVTTTPAYDVHQLYKDNFSSGVDLYPVTIAGDAAGLLGVASTTKLLLTNLRGSSRNAEYNSTTYPLAAYESVVITR